MDRDDPLDIAVVRDSPDENWAAMDLVGEMLVDQWRATPAQVHTTCLSLPIPPVLRRFPGMHQRRAALNADRALVRYLAYPLRALALRRPYRFFHIVDHSYAQLVHVLPSARTGVYCHDTDAFLLGPVASSPRIRKPLVRSIAWALLRGLQAARVVFYSTRVVGRTLERLVQPARLVHAPYGTSPEFTAQQDPNDGADEVLSILRGRPFVLHVGSSVQRKRLDVLFEVFARVRELHPDLRLVQQGATLSPEQRQHVARLGIGDALFQPPKLGRPTLAGLYRRASVAVVTSEAEGFGIPVIEAMACGAKVVATDIPVLREVGAGGALYAPLADIAAWTALLDGLLRGQIEGPSKDRRLERARSFSWARHARTILDAYRNIAKYGVPNAETSAAFSTHSSRHVSEEDVA